MARNIYIAGRYEFNDLVLDSMTTDDSVQYFLKRYYCTQVQVLLNFSLVQLTQRHQPKTDFNMDEPTKHTTTGFDKIFCGFVQWHLTGSVSRPYDVFGRWRQRTTLS